MHIPDGYLSPATCAGFYAIMAPVWYFASKRAEAVLRHGKLPLLALGASFSFIVMMLNIPIPGGSTGHITGGAIAGIVLGPWAGTMALSLTLALQAFLFGDGGITTLAANCFNMAVLMSFSGFFIYKALAIGNPGSGRRFAAAAVAGYVSLNLTALAAGIELGVQPIIAHAADGRPLYAPYPLSISVPAMMLPHMLFFGPVEAIGTGLVISYAYRMNIGIGAEKGGSYRPLWIAVAVLALLTPLGLLAAGTSWGEWGTDELKRALGFVPAGMERLSHGWKGLLPDYGLPGWGGLHGAVLYVLAAFIGSVAVVAAVYIWGRLWKR